MLERDSYIFKAEISDAIRDLKLDLAGLTILTEAASGIFALTPFIAILAGAQKVYAISQTTRYGLFQEVFTWAHHLAQKMHVDVSRLKILEKQYFHNYHDVDIVTNLGHVRPLNKDMLSQLKSGAVISYMCESWEHRKQDIDLALCRQYNIPVCGTNEEHPSVNCFRETGLLALQLIFEARISLFNANIAIISRDKFGREIFRHLNHFTPNIVLIDNFDDAMDDNIKNLDLCIVADYLYEKTIIGKDGVLPPSQLKKESPVVKIIQYCGYNNISDILDAGLSVYPEQELQAVRMVKTLADISYKAVIRLHTAGLKVGEALARGLKEHDDLNKAIEYALLHSPAMTFM